MRLTDVALARTAGRPAFTAARERLVNADVVTYTTTATAAAPRPWDAGELYREAGDAPRREIRLKFVPYFAWGNRGDTEMTVWLPAR